MASADTGCAGIRRRYASGVFLLASVIALAVPALARADAVTAVNALRAAGCSGTPAARAPARRDSLLDAAARELARGAKLGDALARVGYPVASSTSFHVRGSGEDEAIHRLLAERYCAAVNDPRFVELGVHQNGSDTWIVMAARFAVPFAALTDPAAVALRVIELVNAARGEARECGRDRYGSAPALTLSTVLTAVASVHSLDMAERGSLSHRGSDGSESGERMTRAGYSWQASGENVAAGQSDAEAVVAAWLTSPGHCVTLMEPRFTETGVAFALAPGKNPAVYWTQVFAAPR